MDDIAGPLSAVDQLIGKENEQVGAGHGHEGPPRRVPGVRDRRNEVHRQQGGERPRGVREADDEQIGQHAHQPDDDGEDPAHSRIGRQGSRRDAQHRAGVDEQFLERWQPGSCDAQGSCCRQPGPVAHRQHTQQLPQVDDTGRDVESAGHGGDGFHDDRDCCHDDPQECVVDDGEEAQGAEQDRHTDDDGHDDDACPRRGIGSGGAIRHRASSWGSKVDQVWGMLLCLVARTTRHP